MIHVGLQTRRFARAHPVRAEQAGLGLVELMVSLTIGLVIIAAMVALFMGTSRNNRALATASSVIENGRFAMQLLENDIVHAGYWGTHVPQFDNPTISVAPTDVPAAAPDPCLSYANAADWDVDYRRGLIGLPVQAFDAAAVCGGVGQPVQDLNANSDVLIVRHADTCVAGEANCEADTPGEMYFQSSLCSTNFPNFVIGVTGTDAFPMERRDCATAAEKRRLVSNIYFVRDYAVTLGDGIPTLMRSEFGAGAGEITQLEAVPLIEGVEAFRVELGVDDKSMTDGDVNYAAAIIWADPDERTTATNRGDGMPDEFVRCTTADPCDVGQFMNVTAVRIYVLARSREATEGYVDAKTYTLGLSDPIGPFNDGFKRHVYTTTVRLPNIAGRRARP